MIRARAIKPGPFRADAIFKRMKQAAERSADRAEKEFAKTYKTWEHKPKFEKKIKVTGRGISWEVWTDDQIYTWVSGGTEGPYKIPKAGPGLLVFPSGYKAKTKPNLLFSRSGGPYGEHVFAVGQFEHPGIEPRNFDKVVLQYVMPWYIKWNRDAVKVGARESGHSI
jgi:hypothetical protein